MVQNKDFYIQICVKCTKVNTSNSIFSFHQFIRWARNVANCFVSCTYYLAHVFSRILPTNHPRYLQVPTTPQDGAGSGRFTLRLGYGSAKGKQLPTNCARLGAWFPLTDLHDLNIPDQREQSKLCRLVVSQRAAWAQTCNWAAIWG